MKKSVMRFIAISYILTLLLVAFPVRSEQIDLNSVPEQYGMKEAKNGKFWADDPAKYAAAQQIHQEEINKHSWLHVFYYGCGAVVAGWLLIKLRRLRNS